MTINNLTTRTVSISPKAIVCEIKLVVKEDPGQFANRSSNVSPKLHRHIHLCMDYKQLNSGIKFSYNNYNIDKESTTH